LIILLWDRGYTIFLREESKNSSGLLYVTYHQTRTMMYNVIPSFRNKGLRICAQELNGLQHSLTLRLRLVVTVFLMERQGEPYETPSAIH